MAHAFSMNYEREIRENEIRLRNEQIAERRGWPGIGTLPKKYPLPDTVEGDLEIYWESLIDSGLGWHSVKANYGAARRCIKALMDAGLNYETALIDRASISAIPSSAISPRTRSSGTSVSSGSISGSSAILS